MLIATHFITAGVVGEIIGIPVVAFLVGIIIHLILDSIPHYDTPQKGSFFNWKQISLVIIDFLVGLGIIIYLLKSGQSLTASFFWGGLGGIFIDLFDSNPFFSKKFRTTKIGQLVHKIHLKVHKKQPTFIYGIFSQLLVLLIAVIVLIKFH